MQSRAVVPNELNLQSTPWGPHPGLAPGPRPRPQALAICSQQPLPSWLILPFWLKLRTRLDFGPSRFLLGFSSILRLTAGPWDSLPKADGILVQRRAWELLFGMPSDPNPNSSVLKFASRLHWLTLGGCPLICTRIIVFSGVRARCAGGESRIQYEIVPTPLLLVVLPHWYLRVPC